MSFGYGGLMLLDTAGGGMDIFGGMNLFKKLTELTGNVRLPRRGSDEIDCGMYILLKRIFFIMYSFSVFVNCVKLTCDHFLQI